MSRQGNADAESMISSDDSLRERINQAERNTLLNTTFPEPPKVDFTRPADFLTTESDEEQALKAHSTDKPPFIQSAETFSSTSQRSPTPHYPFCLPLPPDEMDRRLRQNKPRLMLMGQRR